jgi:uncharacterized protein (TIGR04222 family)
VDLVVDTSGAYAVTEAITFDLRQGTFTQGERRIPTEQMDALHDVEVTSAQVAITDVSTRTQSGERVIQWQYPERDTTTTFTLTYVVEGAPYTDNGQTVIDWQAVGDAWNVPIRAMQATVQLPFPSVPRDSIQVEPTADATLDSTATGWQATFAYDNLAPNEGYRLRIHLPRVIDAPERAPKTEPNWTQIFGALALVLVGGGAGGVWVWRTEATPAQTRSGYRAPNMPIDEVGFLLMRTSITGWMRVFSAMLFDLAQRGHLTLRRVTKEASWTDSSTSETKIDLHRNGDDRLTEREKVLIDELRTHDTVQAFYKEGSTFRQKQATQIRDTLIERGWIETHPVRSWGGGLGGVLLVGGGIAALIGLSGWAAAIGAGLGVGGGVGALIIATQYRTLTSEGATQHAHAEAHQAHLREEIEATIETNPAAAAHQFMEALPWMALDANVNGTWLDTLNEALADHPEDIALPDWVENAVAPEADDVVTSFLPIYLVYVSTLPSAGTGSSMSTVGSVSAGAGAVGGAGGGGGGVS